MQGLLRLAMARAARALLWLVLLPYRAWVGLLRGICLLECWSSDVLSEHHAARRAALLDLSEDAPKAPAASAKVIPFRRHTA